MDAGATDGASDPVAGHHPHCLLDQLGTVKSRAQVSGTYPDVCWSSGCGVAGVAWVAEWSCDTYSQASWSEACVIL